MLSKVNKDSDARIYSASKACENTKIADPCAGNIERLKRNVNHQKKEGCHVGMGFWLHIPRFFRTLRPERDTERRTGFPDRPAFSGPTCSFSSVFEQHFREKEAKTKLYRHKIPNITQFFVKFVSQMKSFKQI